MRQGGYTFLMAHGQPQPLIPSTTCGVFAGDARGNVAPLHSYEVKTKCWANAI